MPLLSKNDLLEAQEHGFIRVDNASEFNATSVDIAVMELLTPAMEEKDMKPVPLVDGDYWVLEPKSFYLFRTVERFFFSPGFHAQIHSRSSSARHGLALRDADDEFYNNFHNTFEGHAICSIKTLGTTVLLRPGDSLGQAHIMYEHQTPVMDPQLREMIKDGRLEMTKNGERIDSLVQTYYKDGRHVMTDYCDGQKINSSFTLTTDPIIKLYTGLTIDHHSPDPDCFREEVLPAEGRIFREGTFFLSASAESVKIDSHYVGWVDEWNHMLVTSGYRGPSVHHPAERPFSLQTHAAAPKIDPFPRFHGKITFENLAWNDTHIRPGDRLTDFYLFQLSSPIPEAETSRYKGQSEATNSKAELDY